MIAYSASDAKQNFAAMLDAAARQPVVIRRHDRDVAMVISTDQFRRLHRLNVDEFNRLADAVGSQAEGNGLTDTKLSRILAADE